VAASFRDQVIWITGASSGIGEQLAYAFAIAGAQLILSARNAPALERVRVACPEPGRVHLLPVDLSDLDALASTAAAAERLLGRVDMLVNNAGVAVRDFALATTLDVDRRLMTVNYLGPVTLTKAVLPAMLARGSGRIVMISSLSGSFGVPRAAAYSASKHALHGFVDSLRMELRGRGVAITTVIPGVIRTDITTHALDGNGAPTGRMEQAHLEGMSAGRCAAGIVQGLATGREEFFVGGKEFFLLPFHRLFPRLFYRFLAGHPVRRLRRIRGWFSNP
jgi:dehydrogenase/reductase SDR family member 7B